MRNIVGNFNVTLPPSTKTILLGLLLCIFFSVPLFAGDPPPAVQAEVAHLLDYIDSSGCRFWRNGSWYDAHQARAHLELKYRYLCKKGGVLSTEDVIELIGSRSSLSGKPYEIKCGDTAPVFTGDWLRQELSRFRERESKS